MKVGVVANGDGRETSFSKWRLFFNIVKTEKKQLGNG